MKNFFKLFGIIAIAAVIGFSMTACKDPTGGSGGGGGGDKYTLHGSGLTSSEWNGNSLLGSSTAVTDVINKSLTTAQFNSAFAQFESDPDGLHKTNQTIDQLRAAYTSYGITSPSFDTVIDKLNSNGGWVIFATTQGIVSGDYANVIAIKKQ